MENQEQAPKYLIIPEEVVASVVDALGQKPGTANGVVCKYVQQSVSYLSEEELQLVGEHRQKLEEEKAKYEKAQVKKLVPKKNSKKK